MNKTLENYFSKYRNKIIGQNQTIKTCQQKSIRIIYADWTASGRSFSPIEEIIKEKFLPFIANPHTGTTYTGHFMAAAYNKAKKIIKNHVQAGEKDILISYHSGMTGVINKFQRILGFKIHEKFKDKITLKEEERPVIFITHMEHHSNESSWLETIGKVVLVPPDKQGLVRVENFKKALEKYKNYKTKIAAITSCSNVTGIKTPYLDIAHLMHEVGGLCFVDFACSAPYVNIDMHSDDSKGRFLDAIYFSPHKFLGGPSSTGILIFNKKLYSNKIPDCPGGGVVSPTSPRKLKYFDDIETREDGGTPAFLQTIKAALSMQLKEEMGVANIQKREEEILEIIWQKLEPIKNLHVLAPEHKKRLGIISFFIDGLHYNLGVTMLNDRFGIQTRGGCSCAKTYGSYLLGCATPTVKKTSTEINTINCPSQPGWIRLSIHPTHTNEEIEYMMEALKELAENHSTWIKDYQMKLTEPHVKSKKLASTLEIEKNINNSFNKSFV